MKKTQLAFDRISRSRRDRTINPKFDYQETAYQFKVNQIFSDITLTGSVEIGETKNDLLQKNNYPFKKISKSP